MFNKIDEIIQNQLQHMIFDISEVRNACVVATEEIELDNIDMFRMRQNLNVENKTKLIRIFKGEVHQPTGAVRPAG